MIGAVGIKLLASLGGKQQKHALRYIVAKNLHHILHWEEGRGRGERICQQS